MMHFELAQNNWEVMVLPSFPRSPGQGWQAAAGIREGRKVGVRWIFTPPILLGAPPDPAHNPNSFPVRTASLLGAKPLCAAAGQCLKHISEFHSFIGAVFFVSPPLLNQVIPAPDSECNKCTES